MHVDSITQSDLDGFVSFAKIGNAIDRMKHGSQLRKIGTNEWLPPGQPDFPNATTDENSNDVRDFFECQ